VQVGFLPHFLDVLRAAASHPTSPLYGKLDFNNMGAAGHSRGAKIAALHFAGMGLGQLWVYKHNGIARSLKYR
jgi:hypothetical protein